MNTIEKQTLLYIKYITFKSSLHHLVYYAMLATVELLLLRNRPILFYYGLSATSSNITFLITSSANGI